jgi:hypothetical protein
MQKGKMPMQRHRKWLTKIISNMQKLFITTTLVVVFGCIANAQGLTNFVGKYEFGEEGGRTAGGTFIYIGHDLTINSNGTGRLTAAGYQTSREMFIKTKVVGKKLRVIFDKYDADGSNMFDSYKGSEVLFSFEWKSYKGKRVLWTTFARYEPAAIGFKKTGGVYFRKSKV